MPNYNDMVHDDDREYAQRKYLLAPFESLMEAVSVETEIAEVRTHGDESSRMTIPHPYISDMSWIRAMPERGTKFLTMFRSDQGRPQLMGSIQRAGRKRLQTYRDGNNLYRPLFPGELDLMSFGTGELYLARRPLAELKGGLITRWADQDKLTSGDRAPLHHKQFLQNRSNDIVDEERIGIVSRPKNIGGSDFSTWERVYPKVRDSYTAEHYTHMVNPANESPRVLFIRQSGHVLDAKGAPILQNRTRLALRHREQYFANDDSSTISEIDEKGNWAIKLAEAASEGYELSIPKGGYTKTVKNDETITVQRNKQNAITGSWINQIGENLKFSVGGDIEFRSTAGGQTFLMTAAQDEQQTILTTIAGHSFVIDDTVGAELIKLTHKTGAQVEIDEEGSVKVIDSSGGNMFLDATNKAATMTSGLGSFISLKDRMTMVSGGQMISMDGTANIQVTSNQAVLLQAPKVAIQGGAIELGNLATFSAVLAEPLAALFDTHFHPTPMGPSGPPLPPTTAAIVNANPATSFASTAVKIKTNLV